MRFLEQLDRKNEAAISYEEAIRLARPENNDAAHGTAPSFIEALFRLASIYEAQGRAAEVLAVWDEALAIADNSVIWDVQDLMRNAGYYTGNRTDIYDQATKASVRACLSDAECSWRGSTAIK